MVIGQIKKAQTSDRKGFILFEEVLGKETTS